MVIRKYISVFISCFFVVFILLSVCNVGSCQKPPIDTNAYKRWTVLKSPYLASNGRFYKYVEYNDVLKRASIFIKAVKGNWTLALPDGQLEFAANDNYAVFKRGDSLTVYKLGGDIFRQIRYSYSWIPSFNNCRYLLYQPIERPQDLIVLDLERKIERRFDNVGKVRDGKTLSNNSGIVLRAVINDSTQLKYIDLKEKVLFQVSREKRVSSYWVNPSLASEIVYMAGDGNGSDNIYVYETNNRTSRLVRAGNTGTSTTVGIVIDGFNDENQLSVRIDSSNVKHQVYKNPIMADVDIWSYKDDDDKLPGSAKARFDRFSKPLLLSLRDGLLYPDVKNDEIMSFIEANASLDSLVIYAISPQKKYILFRQNDDYWSYEVGSKIRRNLTEAIDNDFFGNEEKDDDFFFPQGGFVAWDANEDAVFVKDEFDVWKLSMKGAFEPINITNGYGRRNKRIFYLVSNISLDNRTPIVESNKGMLFSVFDTKDKKNGFYSKPNLNSASEPDSLILDNAMYWVPIAPLSFTGLSMTDYKPQKAKDANLYLVAKSTSQRSLNFFLTRDFRSFTTLTDNGPEKDYNWLTTELISWYNNEGKRLQGIVFKPEDFDSTRKYPVIFYYYRKGSMLLNEYLEPRECPGCIIDIPTYVSNGYLVVVPDIHFKKGEPGESALSAVESVARFVATRPYVNPRRMGIQGCSFSGFTTNYIVTHSDLFAAACSASGLFDFISGYNSFNAGEPKQSQFEKGPYQIGATLWDNPRAYINNSAIFSASNLTTPFLMMHTTADGLVPMFNAMEFFLAARRLGKKTWMLQYGNGQDHVLEGQEGKDFNIRMRQFFDYYLKDTYPPKWMTVGRPFMLKNIDDGLGLDSSGTQP